MFEKEEKVLIFMRARTSRSIFVQNDVYEQLAYFDYQLASMEVAIGIY
jgi:hypothetical protein